MMTLTKPWICVCGRHEYKDTCSHCNGLREDGKPHPNPELITPLPLAYTLMKERAND